MIDFAVPGKQETPRGARKRGLKTPPHRGYFHDVRTLAAALLSRKFSLGALADHLGVKTRKHEVETYDAPLTQDFIEYARADVQATWECFEKLRDLYVSYRLPRPLHRIQSEASIGKASLQAMGIRRLLKCRPKTSRREFGRIMATYYGGRAEVRIRRDVRQVLVTDFKSMYPTVCTLMGIDRFVVADGYTSEDTTPETQAFIDAITLDNLQCQETWPRLFAYAISAKRYALFNVDPDGRPIIRKFSAHGLGHLMDPYLDSDPAPGVPEPIEAVGKLGGKRWQYDFWYHVLLAALAGTPDRVRHDYHPALSKPAMSRYGATSPALLRWMKPFNAEKAYGDQVKPFGFLVAFMARGMTADDFEDLVDEAPKRGKPSRPRKWKPIAPFERDPKKAVAQAFDRETGETVEAAALQTCAEALRFYHVSPEDKFENGGPADIGRTERRHLVVTAIRLIGKEANRVGDTGQADPVSRAVAEFGSPGARGRRNAGTQGRPRSQAGARRAKNVGQSSARKPRKFGRKPRPNLD